MTKRVGSGSFFFVLIFFFFFFFCGLSTKHSVDTALLHARQEVKSDRSLDGDTIMEIVL